jgi:hypothetical protein
MNLTQSEYWPIKVRNDSLFIKILRAASNALRYVKILLLGPTAKLTKERDQPVSRPVEIEGTDTAAAAKK